MSKINIKLNWEELKARIDRIKLFASDVDGVLTDAGMYYTENGDELKKFNTRDGGGLWLLKNAGIKTALLTSENTRMVERRAKKLRVDYYYSIPGDKWETLQTLLAKVNLSAENVAYIGDDINDISIIENAGLTFTVADGVDEVKDRVDVILSRKGGEGAVREAAELILKTQGTYQQALEMYFEQKKGAGR